MSSDTSIMLAAGGTGGHLFPAFALAEELQRRGVAVDLITDMRGDRYGSGFPARQIYQVPAATIAGKNPVALAKTALALARGTKAAHAILGRVKPSAVIGFGGYPTYPPLVAARLRGIPTAVHEQNAVLGRANKLLAKQVTAIATSFERVKFLDGALAAKSVLTGNPVRQVVVDAAAKPFAAPGPADEFRIVVFGGSQGARFFSDAVPPALALLSDAEKRRLSVVQQAREEDLARTREAYAAHGIAATVEPFFKDLPARMADAHLIIARAGASTVAEVTVIGRPSILVPLPGSLDQDQAANARVLSDAGAATVQAQSGFTPDWLAGELGRVLADPGRLAVAAAAARAVATPDAADRLADLVIRTAGL